MGYIHPRKIPFTYFMVLVKKDRAMCMCIDYHALKKKTIKNKYSIPRIDELIDELHNVVYFLKINLRYRYHQIKVREDIQKLHFNVTFKIMISYSCLSS